MNHVHVRSVEMRHVRSEFEREVLTRMFIMPALSARERVLRRGLKKIIDGALERLLKQLERADWKKFRKIRREAPTPGAVAMRFKFTGKEAEAIDSLARNELRRSYKHAVRITARAIGVKIKGGMKEVADPWSIAFLNTRARFIKSTIVGDLEKRVKHEISMGLLKGEGHETIARRMKNLFEDYNSYELKRLARTEVQMVANNGRIDMYRAAGLKEVEFLVTKDERACQKCLMLDGKKYPLEEARAIIPVHPNCRCTFIPTVPGLYGLVKRAMTRIGTFGVTAAVNPTFRDYKKVLNYRPEKAREYWNDEARIKLVVERGAKFGKRDLEKILKQYPAELVGSAVDEIVILAAKNVMYKGEKRIKKMGGFFWVEGKQIVIAGNASKNFVIQALHHELAHSIDDYMWKLPILSERFAITNGASFSESYDWMLARTRDMKYISVYAKKTVYEDFAETWRYYMVEPERVKKEVPNKYKLVDGIARALLW